MHKSLFLLPGKIRFKKLMILIGSWQLTMGTSCQSTMGEPKLVQDHGHWLVCPLHRHALSFTHQDLGCIHMLLQNLCEHLGTSIFHNLCGVGGVP